jgi:hypothetical protein
MGYLRNHNIDGLVEDIVLQLAVNQPDDSKTYICNFLMKETSSDARHGSTRVVEAGLFHFFQCCDLFSCSFDLLNSSPRSRFLAITNHENAYLRTMLIVYLQQFNQHHLYTRNLQNLQKRAQQQQECHLDRGLKTTDRGLENT